MTSPRGVVKQMLIIGDRFSRIQRALGRLKGPARFVIVTEHEAADRLRRTLRTRPNTEEIARDTWALQDREALRQAYVHFMSALNRQHASLLWWAMPFTTKNPLSTPLCQEVLAFVKIVELAEERPKTHLVVVTESRALAGQLQWWGRRRGMSVVRALRRRGAVRWLLTASLPTAALYAYVRAVIVWRLARKSRADIAGGERADVVTTAFPPSAAGPQGWREAYFGPFIERLSLSGRRVILLGVIFWHPVSTVRFIQRLKSSSTFVPVEACLSLRDLTRCLVTALGQWRRGPQLRQAPTIRGVDVSILVHEAIRDSSHSTSLFMHLCIHHSARRLAQRARVERWFYPYENRAWEKMILTGIRDASPRTRCIGYQHATVTPSHLNLIFGPEEASVTPLPDVIVTAGEVVRTWLERDGHHDRALLKDGCALRRHPSSANGSVRRGPEQIQRLLVALASSGQEYRSTYRFLHEALTDVHGYQVRFRPHPEFPFEEMLRDRIAVTTWPHTVSRGSLSEDLAWADAVLYASSTVSVEALSLGVPVIHLELGELLSRDPLFAWQDLKWSVVHPDELLPTLQRIAQIPSDEFAALQQRAREYADRYLSPISEERLRAMTEL